MGVGVSVASVALGAIFIEKHFTTSRADGGVDSAFSLEPNELKSLVIETERAWQGLGSIKYQANIQEEKSKQFRRTIRIKREMKIGDVIQRQDIAIVRPGGGLAPKFLDLIIGKRLARSLKSGDSITFESILG
jgi:N-acetylneuraminate synthase